MAVSGISSAFSGYVQKTLAGAGTASSTQSAALQEATETKAQTLKEAQSGDRAAIKKLSQVQSAQAQQTASQTPASEPGKGVTVDHVA
jgi:hypothetical protein